MEKNLVKKAQDWINDLNLQKHPEGGWFSEIYRSAEIIKKQNLPTRFNGDRTLSTSIYFLLLSPEISAFHKIKQDELWYFHDGSSLTIHVIDTNGEYFELYLGMAIEKNQHLQVIVKEGWLFAASVDNPESFTLVGCNVSPGFDFDDFEMPSQIQLMEKYPQHKRIIKLFSK